MEDKYILAEVVQEILERPENVDLKASYTNLDHADFCDYWLFNDRIVALKLYNLKLNNGIPIKFKELSELQELHLSQNELPELPDKILLELKQLRKLVVIRNRISTFYQLRSLNNLEHLELDYNSIYSIPAELDQLNNLKRLSLRFNKIKEVPAELNFSKLDKLNSLFLDNNHLRDLPESIGQLTAIEELSLSNNQLQELPSSIGELHGLVRLNLDDNKLKDLPDNFVGLTMLSLLRLSNNQFKQFPATIFQLIALKKLFINANQIEVLPDKIDQPTKLENLDLSQNLLKSLAPSLKQFPNLKTLNLARNQIEQLEIEFEYFLELQDLDLSFNQLTSIPDTIDKVKEKLDNFHFEGNNLQIPTELYKKKPDVIIDYLININAQGSLPLNEGKIIVLGEGEAGKTTLINRIIDGEFIEDNNRTTGIVIKPWELMDTGLTLYIWDFGGQEIMHAMHQFFMTKRTLYILACNFQDSKAEEKLIYWLKLIKTVGENCPIIVAISQFDKYKYYNLDKERLQTAYPNIVRFIDTSSKTEQGIEELKETIKEVVLDNSMQHVRDQMPVNQIKVKEMLVKRQKKEHFITLEEYYRLCVLAEVTDPKEQTNLLDLLNDLGIIFHFDKIDPQNLQSPNVLNPKWVTKGIYSIINDPSIAEKGGKVNIYDIKAILAPQKVYENMEIFILGLMEKFKLCLSYGNGTYLIPNLASPYQPPLSDNFNLGLQFYYQYKFLPPALLPQLIVSLQKRLQENWKYGAVFKYQKNKALVSSNSNLNQLHISIIGNFEPQQTLSELCQVIEGLNLEINDEFKPVLYYSKSDEGVNLSTTALIDWAKSGEKIMSVPREDGKVIKVSIEKILRIILPSDEFEIIYPPQPEAWSNPLEELKRLIKEKDDEITYCTEQVINLVQKIKNEELPLLKIEKDVFTLKKILALLFILIVLNVVWESIHLGWYNTSPWEIVITGLTIISPALYFVFKRNNLDPFLKIEERIRDYSKNFYINWSEKKRTKNQKAPNWVLERTYNESYTKELKDQLNILNDKKNNLEKEIEHWESVYQEKKIEMDVFQSHLNAR